MAELMDVALSAAKDAGELLFDNFGKIKEIKKKGDRDFATNLDREAEKLIINRIKTNFPGQGILGEETGWQNHGSDYLWIIDPLDGTHNFMREINIFGVSIGVVYRGKFIAGVIYMPVDNELYAAQQGSGAYKNGKKITVSSTSALKECSISFDSSIRYNTLVMTKTLGKLADAVFNVRMFGSSVRVLTYIAEGRLDASIEFYDKPWDFSGGVCLIEEAGGKLVNLGGKTLTYKDIGYIASNRAIHEKIKKMVLPIAKGCRR